MLGNKIVFFLSGPYDKNCRTTNVDIHTEICIFNTLYISVIFTIFARVTGKSSICASGICIDSIYITNSIYFNEFKSVNKKLTNEYKFY